MISLLRWAAGALQSGNVVALETAGNVWDLYGIVALLATRKVVVDTGTVRQIAKVQVRKPHGRHQAPVVATDSECCPRIVGVAYQCVGVAWLMACCSRLVKVGVSEENGGRKRWSAVVVAPTCGDSGVQDCSLLRGGKR